VDGPKIFNIFIAINQPWIVRFRRNLVRGCVMDTQRPRNDRYPLTVTFKVESDFSFQLRLPSRYVANVQGQRIRG